MNQKENSMQKVKEILAPIKDRPDVHPRPEFVRELQTKIATQKNKKSTYIFKKPILALGSAGLLSVIIFLSLFSNFQPENAVKPVEKSFSILERSKVELVMEIEYGEGENQIGFTPNGAEGSIGSSASSFDVKDGTFYILDNVNDRVMTVGNETQSSFPINDAWDLSDILITEKDEIYVLDSGARLVYQYTLSGELVETHPVSDTVSIPTGLGYLDVYGVTVNQNEMLVSLKTGARIAEDDQPFKAIRVNELEGKILLEKEKEIKIPFEHSFGGITIHSVNENQIVFTKGEIAPKEESIKGEFHVYVINKKGETQGAVRIPNENTVMAPNHPIKTSEDKIYFLSPEAEHLAIYELKAGNSFEKLLDQQREDIGFDYRTFGEPFPELEQDIAELFTSNTIFASYSNEPLLNGVSINEEGEVIVDFKDFNQPGPTTAEKGKISETLSETVFKYQEVEKVYFQFDGSFSDWCSWLEIVEEPMLRPKDEGPVATESDEEVLRQKSDKIFSNLRELNWLELSKEVHPEKGLTFSLYANLGSPDSSEITFTKSEVEKFIADDNRYTWGHDFSDKAFNFTANGFVENILFKHYWANAKKLEYTKVTYNDTSLESGGILNTIHEYYPEAVFVEYHSPPGKSSDETPSAELQWQSLRFVYEKVENEWYLFAIVRDVHSP